jgi:hypothetical protein
MIQENSCSANMLPDRLTTFSVGVERCFACSEGGFAVPNRNFGLL